MASIPKKAEERLSKTIGKFQNILKLAKDRDINESDTVFIINDILFEVFGYDKHIEITSEYAVKSTYCDLAIKIDNKVQFLIEVKAVGIDLKDNHLRQAIDYGATLGAQWVILTNGIFWQLYKIRFEQPVTYDLVCSFNYLELNSRKIEDKEKLFVLCKEGVLKNAREEFYEKVQSVNRFTVGALILNDEIVNIIRKELKKISPSIKVDADEIKALLESEVLKRDVIEGDDAAKAQSRIRRFYSKTSKKVKEASTLQQDPVTTEPSLKDNENAIL